MTYGNVVRGASNFPLPPPPSALPRIILACVQVDVFGLGAKLIAVRLRAGQCAGGTGRGRGGGRNCRTLRAERNFSSFVLAASPRGDMHIEVMAPASSVAENVLERKKKRKIRSRRFLIFFLSRLALREARSILRRFGCSGSADKFAESFARRTLIYEM